MLHFGASLDQFAAHFAEFSALCIDLRHRFARGFRFGVGARAGILQLGPDSIDMLLVRGQLVDGGLRLAAINDDLAQQRMSVANEITECVDALQNRQVSG